ncbi:MAG TPA: DUF2254 domain-containing protein [Mycobacteriales bacterium]|nr:DUF2254 domain-containing protein [Mycobacteriales bacterium]
MRQPAQLRPAGLVSASRLRDVLRATFWLVPATCTTAAIALGAGLLAVDQQLPLDHTAILFPGPPAGARSLLSAIITSMISITGLVFSITMVVLQLASAQFSPRVLRMFLADRTIQATLGVFVGTFVYAMVVHRGIRGTATHHPFVPRVAVTGAFLLVLASIGLFIVYISHVANLIRVATIITTIAAETRDLIERTCPPGHDPPPPPPCPSPAHHGEHTVTAPSPGVLVSANHTTLARLAREHDCVLILAGRIGDFIPAGGPLFTVHPATPTTLDIDRLAPQLTAEVALDTERTMEQDIAFGFRQLIDIAQRALSPAVNDPTTATQVLDALHDLLRRLATRHLPTGWTRDQHDTPRLLVHQYRFADYLNLTVAEIWRYGADVAQIPGRMTTLLTDLADAALPENHHAITTWTAHIHGPGAPPHGSDTSVHTPPTP